MGVNSSTSPAELGFSEIPLPSPRSCRSLRLAGNCLRGPSCASENWPAEEVRGNCETVRRSSTTYVHLETPSELAGILSVLSHFVLSWRATDLVDTPFTDLYALASDQISRTAASLRRTSGPLHLHKVKSTCRLEDADALQI